MNFLTSGYQVNLNSKYATSSNATNNECSFFINNIAIQPDGHYSLLKVSHASFPNV